MWRKQGEGKLGAEPEPAPAIPPERPAVLATTEPRSESTRITATISVKGEMSGREDVYLDGTLEGSVRLPDSRLTVGPHGRLTADVEAAEIIVEGRVTGNLRARTRVELRRTCRVRGDISTERIAIHEGAHFNGRVDITRGEEARLARAASAGAEFRAVPVAAAEGKDFSGGR
jgi:cytoskeletal protein CcmA (bactofilin family)